MIERPSPNHDTRNAPKVQMLVLHYTGMRDAKSALDHMCDPASGVSAHYMVDEDGSVYQLVPEELRAWHAGDSSWRGVTDVNSLAIGIELVNPGHQFGYRDFTDFQMDALLELTRDIVARLAIRPEYVLGHSDVAPLRKMDPGERFDWSTLARHGVGLWPFRNPALGMAKGPVLKVGSEGQEVAAVQDLLGRFGYAVPQTGLFDEETSNVTAAFQRHFRPAGITGQMDVEAVRRLVDLIEHVGV